ncbi:MAG: hypothetical protein JST89_04445 [Cyanobacteria bacterium SZAS-4]|nr:hypothetical protein [Cyanobacteria bacterium SZAS-4]
MMQQDNITFIKQAPIEALALPPGWFEDSPEQGPLPTSYKRRFKSFATPTSELFIWFRGQPVDSDSCENLMRLLSERAQILTKTKTNSIIRILGNLGHEPVFRALMIRTEAISGANVLSVEGRWSNDEDVYALLMPESPGSSRIIELHYQAPKEEFRKNLAAMKAAFASIEWCK